MGQELRVRVARKEQVALEIALFELVGSDGAELPPFSAGSHIDVHIPGGLVRQYSLCNAQSESHRYQIAVLKDAKGRGGSRGMHELVHAGDEIAISAPKNHFALAHATSESLLLAGGIGITPLLCMAERLATLEKPFTLHYCTRSAERTAFRERIRDARFAQNVQFHFDNGPAEQKVDLKSLLSSTREGAHLYTCGPKGFMDAVLAQARLSGWREDQLHYEFFNAAPTRGAADEGFDVQLASSGRIIRVSPQETIVEALAACGVHIPTSCEQGVCGTCLTRVLDGELDHRDLFLTRDEQAAGDQFLPCCSRAKSAKLVLDL